MKLTEKGYKTFVEVVKLKYKKQFGENLSVSGVLQKRITEMWKKEDKEAWRQAEDELGMLV